MARYRVVVEEIQTYEVYVEAPNDIEAERIALSTYGCDGEVTDTDINAVLTEEEDEE